MQSPADIRLPQFANKELNMQLIDLFTHKCETYPGVVNQQGAITLYQVDVQIEQPKLLYVTLQHTHKCIYLCLAQGSHSPTEVRFHFSKLKSAFHSFLKILFRIETNYLCFGCYLEFMYFLRHLDTCWCGTRRSKRFGPWWGKTSG